MIPIHARSLEYCWLRYQYVYNLLNKEVIQVAYSILKPTKPDRGSHTLKKSYPHSFR